MTRPFDLDRFVDAQIGIYGQALAELRAGRKQSHWMWFVFPQLGGLGLSALARHFAISGRDEARAYLNDDLLGPRLVECVEAVLRHPDLSPEAIFGSIDALKFRSSMTLFEAVAGAEQPAFTRALDSFYEGARDQRTLALLD